MSRRARATHDFRDIILPSRNDAEVVIERLTDAIEMYATVTVEDLYDLIGITGDFTDGKYGWTTPRGMRVVRVPDGYILDLPNPQPID